MRRFSGAPPPGMTSRSNSSGVTSSNVRSTSITPPFFPWTVPRDSPIVTTSAPSDSRLFFGSIASESSKLFARTIATLFAISRSFILRHDPRQPRNSPSDRQYTGRSTLIRCLLHPVQGAYRVDASFPVGIRDEDARAVLDAIDPEE